MPFSIKRAYDPPADADGVRILVDRLWPRGVSKAAAHIEHWLKDLAPSDALRKWFDHDPARWEAFKARYFKELSGRAEAVSELRKFARSGPVTLVFAAKDAEHNNAVALKEFLGRRPSQGRPPAAPAPKGRRAAVQHRSHRRV
jgi:uncharacterized protein YeaO (DUF488 family)